MKTWLGAAGRLCADCVLVLLLLVLVSVLGAEPGLSEPSLLVLRAGEAGTRLLPLAATAALFLGFFAFEGKLGRRYRLISWLSALILGFGLLVGGSALRRQDFDLGSPKPPEPALAQGGVILDRGEEGLWASSFDRDGGSKVLAFRAGAPLLEGLGYAPRASYGQTKGEVVLASRTWPLATLPVVSRVGLPGIDLEALAARMDAVDALPFPLALAALGGFALLAAGLVGFSRLPRWPLVGFFFAVGAFLALLALDGALSGPEAGHLLARLSPRLGLAWLPPILIVAGVEACLGLILGALTLPSWGRADE